MSDSAPTSRFAKLNPFKRRSKRGDDNDDEDKGEEIDSTTVAGGGHSVLPTDLARQHLRVSDALKRFLVGKGLIGDVDDQEGLKAIVDQSAIVPPPEVTDRSHPLPEYFISSSHNTYLMAHQLFGSSSADAYETTLKAGSRCVEIDAWDNPDDKEEPKVTHGYTLVSNIPFRAVCETIRDVVDHEASLPRELGYAPAPILLSLENHCGPAGQLRLVQIMNEVWGDRLLSAPVCTDGDPNNHVHLSDLGAKIAVIVEHHIPGELSDSDDSSSSSSSSDSEPDEKQAREDYKAKKKAAPAAIIIPELEALGIYAQSVKPADDSWYADATGLKNAPHHPLINVSETQLAAHVTDNAAAIARHNSRHLMRVYPKGTRISSRNLPPVQFWALGAQICALNWQTFGASMQLNEALFAGTSGYVLKPAYLRAGGSGAIPDSPKKILKLRVAGATDVPVPASRDADKAIKPYLTCTLLQPGPGGALVTVKRKTGVYKGGDVTDPVWDDTLEWEVNASELVFLRLLIKSDDSFSSNPVLAVAAVRLLYVASGWKFLRMLDLRGHGTGCSLLVNFEMEDV